MILILFSVEKRVFFRRFGATVPSDLLHPTKSNVVPSKLFLGSLPYTNLYKHKEWDECSFKIDKKEVQFP
jgi:hypothetical protein